MNLKSCLIKSPENSSNILSQKNNSATYSKSNSSNNRTVLTSSTNSKRKLKYESDKENCHQYPMKEVSNEKDSIKMTLGIIEGSELPCLNFKPDEEPSPPNCYAQLMLPSINVQTSVIRKSSDPKWNFKMNLDLKKKDLLMVQSFFLKLRMVSNISYFFQTENQLLFIINHAMDTVTVDVDDPVIGYATLDVNQFSNSFESVCGWIPIRSRNNQDIGSLKVSASSL